MYIYIYIYIYIYSLSPVLLIQMRHITLTNLLQYCGSLRRQHYWCALVNFPLSQLQCSRIFFFEEFLADCNKELLVQVRARSPSCPRAWARVRSLVLAGTREPHPDALVKFPIMRYALVKFHKHRLQFSRFFLP